MAQVIQIQSSIPRGQLSGVGDGLAKLGDSLFGNEAQSALIREKALEAQRLNAGKLDLGAGLRAGNLSPEELAARGLAAGLGGTDLGGFSRYINASKFGAEDPRTQGSQIAAGQGYGDTYGGVKLAQDTSRANNAATNATNIRIADATPTKVLGANGQTEYVPQSGAYGRQAPEGLDIVKGNVARRNIDPATGQFGTATPVTPMTQRFIGASPNQEHIPEIVRLQQARDALPPGDPRRGELDKAINAKGISPGGEGTYDQTLNKGLATVDEGIMKDAAGSGQRLAMLGNIENLIASGKAITGPGSQYVLALKQAGRMLGVPVEGVAETELVRAMGNKLLLDLAPNGSLGAQISNADTAIMGQTVPGMANTPGGNLALIQTLRKVEQRKREVAQWAAEYKAARGGRLDAGWPEFLSQKAEANPLFPRQQPAAPTDRAQGMPTRGAPKPGHVEDGYEFVGGNPASSSNWRPVR